MIFLIKGKTERNPNIPGRQYQMYVSSILKLKSGEYVIYWNCNKTQAKKWKTVEGCGKALQIVRQATEAHGGYEQAESVVENDK